MKRTKALNSNTAANPAPTGAAERPIFSHSLPDVVIAHYKKPADLIGEKGMLKQLTKAVFEAALDAEINRHLGHTRHVSVGNDTCNVRKANYTNCNFCVNLSRGR